VWFQEQDTGLVWGEGCVGFGDKKRSTRVVAREQRSND